MEYEDQERWLRERIQKENEELVRHLRAIKNLIETKCFRCKKGFSCYNCPFSRDEMLGKVEDSLRLMRRLV